MGGAELHAGALSPSPSLVRRPSLALEGLARPNMRAAASASRPSRWVVRRAIDRDEVVGFPLARRARAKRGSCVLRALALRRAVVRLREAAR